MGKHTRIKPNERWLYGPGTPGNRLSIFNWDDPEIAEPSKISGKHMLAWMNDGSEEGFQTLTAQHGSNLWTVQIQAQAQSTKGINKSAIWAEADAISFLATTANTPHKWKKLRKWQKLNTPQNSDEPSGIYWKTNQGTKEHLTWAQAGMLYAIEQSVHKAPLERIGQEIQQYYRAWKDLAPHSALDWETPSQSGHTLHHFLTLIQWPMDPKNPQVTQQRFKAVGQWLYAQNPTFWDNAPEEWRRYWQKTLQRPLDSIYFRKSSIEGQWVTDQGITSKNHTWEQWKHIYNSIEKYRQNYINRKNSHKNTSWEWPQIYAQGSSMLELLEQIYPKTALPTPGEPVSPLFPIKWGQLGKTIQPRVGKALELKKATIHPEEPWQNQDALTKLRYALVKRSPHSRKTLDQWMHNPDWKACPWQNLRFQSDTGDTWSLGGWLLRTCGPSERALLRDMKKQGIPLSTTVPAWVDSKGTQYSLIHAAILGGPALFTGPIKANQIALFHDEESAKKAITTIAWGSEIRNVQRWWEFVQLYLTDMQAFDMLALSSQGDSVLHVAAEHLSAINAGWLIPRLILAGAPQEHRNARGETYMDVIQRIWATTPEKQKDALDSAKKAWAHIQLLYEQNILQQEIEGQRPEPALKSTRHRL